MEPGAPGVRDVAVPVDADGDRRLEHLDRDVADVRAEVRDAVLAFVVGLAAPRPRQQLDHREALAAWSHAADRDQRQATVRGAHDPVRHGLCQRPEHRVERRGTRSGRGSRWRRAGRS